MATKYTTSRPTDFDRFAAHRLKDLHFEGDKVFDKLVPMLESTGDIINRLKGFRHTDDIVAIQLIPQEREATDTKLIGGRVETTVFDIVNFTITILFTNKRPFTFYFEVPYNDAEDNWYKEALSSFISQSSTFLLRQAERKGFRSGIAKTKEVY